MRKLLAILATALFLISTMAQASSGGGGGGPSPYAKLETFTVNLKGLNQYLQVNMSLKIADPKLADSIKAWSPVIRHELILLLSSQSGEELATLAGKQKVMAAIKTAINKVLKLDDKDGVTDVLFESFVIQ
jgi:flagellar FliL protein